ncbi:MAG TPA: adenylate/guanylate cyclase domain-containing protein [Actinomycetota bacterium]|nr:adenylate/guanylate cyclase domain-containing protein [Actinomycetota bacterium]
MKDLPTGTVTFLFTDIEGSTRLLQSLGERYRGLQADHAAILRGAIAAAGGTEVSTEGDSFFAVFPTAPGALAAAVAAQGDLAAHRWPHGEPLRIRMGLHTGEAVPGGDNYVGLDVNRAARIAAAAHGGQVLISEATRSLARAAMPSGTSLRDLGEHRLKDLAELERLYQVVIEGLPSEFPPPRTVDARPNNLPLQLTSFVGRHDELRAVVELLAGHRLVTLTGPGGTGKTRLAIQAAAEALVDFRDGAFFVDLSPLTDPDLVPAAIAETLGVREALDRALLDSVADHLRGRDLLLVLDNFEQVTEAAPVVERLLREAPKLKILATSRAVLRLYGEQEMQVPPLSLPDPAHLPEPDELTAYDAVALFTERAGSARPGFRVSEENAVAVAAITAKLDGLPLAIELAASRIKVLPPEAILERLDRRLALLSTTARNLPERQRTLRGAIAWSHDLLAEEERRLFARFGVFAGGATLTAVEEVCNPGAELGLDTLDAVASLIDKSLLRQAESDGDPRLAMLETIREFSVERLAQSGERDEIHRRHTEHLTELAERATPHLRGPEQAEWTLRLERELDNVRAALTWAIETGQPPIGLRLAAALREFWRLSGHFGEGRRWIDRLVAMPGAEATTAERARALVAGADLSGWLGDLEHYMPYAAEALEIFRELGDRPGTADALEEVGAAAMLTGDLSAARPAWAEARDLNLELGNPHKAAESFMGLGMVDILLGEPERAAGSLEEAIRRFEELGDGFFAAFTGRFLGVARHRAGDHQAARERYARSLRVFHELGTLVELAMVMDSFAELALDEGDAERAIRLVGVADALRERSESIGQYDVWVVDVGGRSRAALDDQTADRLYAEGQAMGGHQAVAYALEEGPA